jgi:hypothetical protein
VTADLVGKFSAADLAKAAVMAMGGQGAGGKADFAQGGAPDATKAQDGLDAIKAALAICARVSSPSSTSPARYCSSATGSIHVTGDPFSASVMAMWLMAVVAVAPCQCRRRQGHQTTSPARISVFGPPSHCVHPTPDVTMRVCPNG